MTLNRIKPAEELIKKLPNDVIINWAKKQKAMNHNRFCRVCKYKGEQAKQEFIWWGVCTEEECKRHNDNTV